MAGCDCSANLIPAFYRNGELLELSQDDRQCNENNLNLCEAECLTLALRP